jgi:hypothetical protein
MLPVVVKGLCSRAQPEIAEKTAFADRSIRRRINQ